MTKDKAAVVTLYIPEASVTWSHVESMNIPTTVPYIGVNRTESGASVGLAGEEAAALAIKQLNDEGFAIGLVVENDNKLYLGAVYDPERFPDPIALEEAAEMRWSRLQNNTH